MKGFKTFPAHPVLRGNAPGGSMVWGLKVPRPLHVKFSPRVALLVAALLLLLLLGGGKIHTGIERNRLNVTHFSHPATSLDL